MHLSPGYNRFFLARGMGSARWRRAAVIGALLFGVTTFVAAVPSAYGIDFTPTGAILTVTYTEPTTNTDGSPLNDLKDTLVKLRVCPVTGTCSAPFLDGVVTPASSPAGGGNISLQQPVGITPGTEVNVEVFALARDLSGNVSPESPHVTKRVDRLPPSAPK